MKQGVKRFLGGIPWLFPEQGVEAKADTQENGGTSSEVRIIPKYLHGQLSPLKFSLLGKIVGDIPGQKVTDRDPEYGKAYQDF